MRVRPVRAALFDLDGTLVDSEVHTDTAIRVVAARHGIADYALPPLETRGRTWTYIAELMVTSAGVGGSVASLADELLTYWVDIAADVTPIPGAPEALHEAARHLKLGVVSSSPRTVIEQFITKIGVAGLVSPAACIGGDAVRASKPDPDGYLKGARALGVAPADCLVFEDSQAGLLAAQNAGMRSMFIRCCAIDIPGNTALATGTFLDYTRLPKDFWARIAEGSLDVTGQDFA
jgi:sugar-phosphatase